MKLLFIIACKYYRNYNFYIEIYINNIQKFYDDVDILIVDNNSKYINDIKNIISKYNNVQLISNKSRSKFELGAYRYGIKYLGDNINKYEYIIFTQDNFIIKKKYDFNKLIKKNVKSAIIVNYNGNLYLEHDIFKKEMEKINRYDKLDEITICVFCCFILHKDVIKKFMDLTKYIKITIRSESIASERYLGRILYELNDYKNFIIDGDYLNLKYDQKMDDKKYLIKKFPHYFQKISQDKTEKTIE